MNVKKVLLVFVLFLGLVMSANALNLANLTSTDFTMTNTTLNGTNIELNTYTYKIFYTINNPTHYGGGVTGPILYNSGGQYCSEIGQSFYSQTTVHIYGNTDIVYFGQGYWQSLYGAGDVISSLTCYTNHIGQSVFGTIIQTIPTTTATSYRTLTLDYNQTLNGGTITPTLIVNGVEKTLTNNTLSGSFPIGTNVSVKFSFTGSTSATPQLNNNIVLSGSSINNDIKSYYNTSNIVINSSTSINSNMSYILDSGLETSICNNCNISSLNLYNLNERIHNITLISKTNISLLNVTASFTIDALNISALYNQSVLQKSNNLSFINIVDSISYIIRNNNSNNIYTCSNTKTCLVHFTNLSQGLNNITVTGNNLNSNESFNFYINYDSIAPVIQSNITNLIHLNNYTYNFSNHLNVTDLHNATYNITINNQPSNYTHIFTTNGNYTIKVIAKDIVNNTNIYTTNIIVDLFRINMTFQSNISTLLLNNINITENSGALNYFSNTSNKLIYRNPGSYNFTFNKSLYNITKIFNYTKDNVTAQQNLLVTFKPIFIFNLVDEKTLQPFNISGTTAVSLKVTCSDGSISQNTITTDSYIFVPTCVPTKFGFSISYLTQNYFRDINIKETNLNRSVYLVDLLTSQAISNTFKIFDLTSNYVNPVISLQKVIPGKGQVEITGDRTDVQNSVLVYLLLNSEYIIQLSSNNLPTKNIGIYVANTPGVQNINLFNINFKSGLVSAGRVSTNIYFKNNTIIGSYNDTSNTTLISYFTIYNQTRYGNILFHSLITNGQSAGSFAYTLPQSLENGTFYVLLTVTTTGQTFNYDKVLRKNNNLGLGILNFSLNLNWIITIFLAFLSLILTIRTSDVGGFIILIIVSFFVVIGWYQLSWVVISLSMLLILLKIFRQGERP